MYFKRYCKILCQLLLSESFLATELWREKSQIIAYIISNTLDILLENHKIKSNMILAFSWPDFSHHTGVKSCDESQMN